MLNRSKLFAMIKNHEGCELKPYLDTQGKLTIGYGRCLDTVGISLQEAEMLLQDDCMRVESECKRLISDFEDLPEPAQEVIFDMVFQMGHDGVQGFKKMLLAIHSRDWNAAADECLDSVYHRQTPSRCEGNADKLRSCSS